MAPRSSKSKKRPDPFRVATLSGIEGDKNHHLTGPFLPQTPLGGASPTQSRSTSPTVSRASAAHAANRSALIRWVVQPALAFKLLLLPLLLWVNWMLVAPYLNPGVGNPFSVFIISGHIPTSSPSDPLYRKTWWDLPFIAYYIVVFSFIRESLSSKVSRPLAKYFGIRNENKIDRFAEQMYALVYFTVFGAWGYRVMAQLPSYWYNTSAFWDAYPSWAIKPELKAYYLIQFAYWWQQLLVLILGLEKPRKDYLELVAHHFVTLWLIGWSYITNHTLIGNAVYMSMDIPDAFLALSKLLNYIQWNTAKTYAFGVFFLIWTYFRHYLNIWILWSVWFESSDIPEWTKKWSWSEGVYMPAWMPYQIFVPLLLLQGLNLFWYSLMTKILIRGIMTSEVDDHRSDDEGGDEDEHDRKED
ncbi:hypothetical protein HYPSUDRAFT_32286 [Hypholoma sublateritium FD-334 SS-4]|uniref:TLC domain-containing protein n=1 Tax=Hypholoma sublateritium (strain FD-334 SS-4) TaxID=945553 RepID=A0A0D2PQ06_HYPSF|nr:hypothetical protein HYPSUDRAFT_32286 [Hypholoma sublateritium FD-334 SS-4]